MALKAEDVHEQWKPIRGSDFHEISSNGRVRNAKTGKLLSVKPNPYGYPVSTFRIVDNCRPWYVHCLVAEAFLGPRPDGHEVNHIDGNKLHASVANLEYVTRAMNIEHAVVNGLSHTGKLSPADVSIIRASHRRGNSGELAQRFGVSREHIVRIVHGKSWAHRATETSVVDPPRNRRGSEQPCAKLNDDAVRDIRARLGRERGKDLALEYGVSTTVISWVKSRKIWKHVA